MRRCVDCAASITHRGGRAVRCRPCNLEAEVARRLARYQLYKLCTFDIATCICGRPFVKRRGNAMFCPDCRIFYRREQVARATRRYYARRIKNERKAA
jgi:hypothetical protein